VLLPDWWFATHNGAHWGQVQHAGQANLDFGSWRWKVEQGPSII
jgi:hypothetical protein